MSNWQRADPDTSGTWGAAGQPDLPDTIGAHRAGGGGGDGGGDGGGGGDDWETSPDAADTGGGGVSAEEMQSIQDSMSELGVAERADATGDYLANE